MFASRRFLTPGVLENLRLRRNGTLNPQTLTHVDGGGNACQIDVSAKDATLRKAKASCRVLLPENVFRLVKENRLKKGDVFSTVRLAGIQGSKLTAQLIPLCHQISLENTEITISLDEDRHSVNISSMTICTGKTGVEMEALTACSVAALCLYDMCKATSQDIKIQDLRLDLKEGGRTQFNRAASRN